MEIRTETCDDIEIINVKAENLNDEMMIRDLGNQVMEHIENQPLEKVLLDMNDVKFISSSMVGRLISIRLWMPPVLSLKPRLRDLNWPSFERAGHQHRCLISLSLIQRPWCENCERFRRILGQVICSKALIWVLPLWQV